MRIYLLLLIAFFACSEIENRPMPEQPEPAIPTIVIASRGAGWGYRASGGTVERSVSFSIGSDIPMPADTYILVNDQFFRMEEGETEIEIVFTKTCPYLTIDYEQPMFMGEIKPPHERVRHLPYHRDGIHVPEGYRFNPYTVGDRANITANLWCE